MNIRTPSQTSATCAVNNQKIEKEMEVAVSKLLTGPSSLLFSLLIDMLKPVVVENIPLLHNGMLTGFF
jgi:hypothetical protein